MLTQKKKWNIANLKYVIKQKIKNILLWGFLNSLDLLVLKVYVFNIFIFYFLWPAEEFYFSEEYKATSVVSAQILINPWFW